MTGFWQPLILAALNTPLGVADMATLARVLRDSLAGARDASDLLLPRVDLSALLPKGVLVLCGLTLRDVSEVQQLPDYWRGLYANHRCGLLNEAVLLPADEATSSRHYACDAYACVHGHSLYAIRLMLRYLYQVAGAVLRLGMAAWSGAAR